MQKILVAGCIGLVIGLSGCVVAPVASYPPPPSYAYGPPPYPYAYAPPAYVIGGPAIYYGGGYYYHRRYWR